MPYRENRRVGLVGLDTSHPATYVPIIRSLGFTVVGVWDAGLVHGPGYADRFVAAHSAGVRFSTLEEMAEHVDVAIVGGVDWNRRLILAEPFAAVGVPMLLSKPAAGGPADLGVITAWSQAGLRVAAGSSLLWAREALAWRRAEGGGLRGSAAIHGHPLDYGVHAVALLLACMGGGVATVRMTSLTMTTWRSAIGELEMRWRDGRSGTVRFRPEPESPAFAAVVKGRAGLQSIAPRAGALHEAMLADVLPFLAGDGASFLSFDSMLEPEFVLVAAYQSHLRGGEWVPLDGGGFRGTPWPSQRFVAGYIGTYGMTGRPYQPRT